MKKKGAWREYSVVIAVPGSWKAPEQDRCYLSARTPFEAARRAMTTSKADVRDDDLVCITVERIEEDLR